MIHEIARLKIDPAEAERFEAAVAACADLFRQAEGCRSMRLERCVEEPACYELRVGWDSVAHHMVQFRESPAFQAWRAKAGAFFVEPAKVIHVETVCALF